MNRFLLIDIGGTSIKATLSCDEHFSKYEQIITNRNKPLDSLEQLIERYHAKDYTEILVSATGVINDQGVVINTNGLLANYLGKDIKSFCADKYQKPCIVLNDVNAFSYHKSFAESAFYLTIGTGIGGAFRLKKDYLLTGYNNAAGEIGLIKIKDQRLEDCASTRGLINLGKNKYNLNINSGIDFFNLALKDENYHACLEEWCTYLAEMIANICYIYNPKNLIIGGAIVKQQVIIKPIIIEKLQQIIAPVYYQDLNIEFVKVEQNTIFKGLINFYKIKNSLK